MTREDSIRTMTWVTDDGRYLTVDKITDGHLRNIYRMLCAGMPPEYNQVEGRELARDLATRRENILDYSVDGAWAELDQNTYAAAWLQIIDDEFARRNHACPVDVQ